MPSRVNLLNYPAEVVVVELAGFVVVVVAGFVVAGAAVVVVVLATLARSDADGGFGNDTPFGTSPTVTSASLLEITTFEGSPVYILGAEDKTELQTAVSNCVGLPLQEVPEVIVPLGGNVTDDEVNFSPL